MAPVPMESILAAPTWPVSLANFVTWCLMWDPRCRPTSIQALQHEYFRDAIDPLLPRASTPSRVVKKSSELAMKPSRDSMIEAAAAHPTLEKKNSWFRKSFIGGRTDGIVSPPPTTDNRPRPDKRNTWHAPKLSSGNGTSNNAAPMIILPSIKPVSPMSDAVSVQAGRTREEMGSPTDRERRKAEEKAVKKIGRQLSVHSNSSQRGYANGVQAAVDKLNGNANNGGLVSPTGPKESFFSHLRKRARRLSGRTGLPPSPGDDDLEIGVGCGIAWGGGKETGSNRSSMLVDSSGDASGIDNAIKEVDAALADSHGVARSNSASVRRNLSFPPTPNASRAGETINVVSQTPGGTFPRTRRSVRNTKQRYETPDENDELADEVLAAASSGYDSRRASSHTFDTPSRKGSNKDLRLSHTTNGYPTPSPQTTHRFYAKGLDISGKVRRDDEMTDPKWPTPPSEGDGGWGLHTYSSNTGSLRR